MKIKPASVFSGFGISAKMTVFVGVVVLAVLAVSATFLYLIVKDVEKESAQRYMESISEREAAHIEQSFEKALDASILLATFFGTIDELPKKDRRSIADALLEGILGANPGFTGIWTCWEPNALDGLDAEYRSTARHDNSGRFIPYWGRGSDGKLKRSALNGYEDAQRGAYYRLSRDSGKAQILEPYTRDRGGSAGMITSLTSPVKNASGTVVGVVGVDISVEGLNAALNKVKFFDTGFVRLMSAQLVVVTHLQPERIGKLAGEFDKGQDQALIEKLRRGEEETGLYWSTALKSYTAKSFVPIFIGDIELPWIVGTVVPEPETMAEANRLLILIILVFILGAALIMITVGLISRPIVRPLRKTSAALADIARGQGDLSLRLESRSSDEAGRLAGDFNSFVDKLEHIIASIQSSVFTLQGIGQGLSAAMEQTSSSVYEINANIESVKRQVVDQSSSATETSATLEEIGKNIVNLNDIVLRQGESLAESSASIEEMVANIASITQTLQKSAQGFTALRGVSEQGYAKISDVMARVMDIERQSLGLAEANQIVQGIASRTNLLAMNAAIEAAHAGQAGKGFAVVSDEIRKLAENAALQSKSISKDLKALKTSIDQVVRSSNEAGEAFGAVRSAIDRAIDEQAQVKTAMDEQSLGNSRVLEALSAMKEQGDQVRDSAAHIKEGSSMITTEMRQLVEISNNIKNSMDEMVSGTGEINKAVSEVVGLSQENQAGIAAVEAQVKRFKTRS